MPANKHQTAARRLPVRWKDSAWHPRISIRPEQNGVRAAGLSSTVLRVTALRVAPVAENLSLSDRYSLNRTPAPAVSRLRCSSFSPTNRNNHQSL